MQSQPGRRAQLQRGAKLAARPKRATPAVLGKRPVPNRKSLAGSGPGPERIPHVGSPNTQLKVQATRELAVYCRLSNDRVSPERLTRRAAKTFVGARPR